MNTFTRKENGEERTYEEYWGKVKRVHEAFDEDLNVTDCCWGNALKYLDNKRPIRRVGNWEVYVETGYGSSPYRKGNYNKHNKYYIVDRGEKFRQFARDFYSDKEYDWGETFDVYVTDTIYHAFSSAVKEIVEGLEKLQEVQDGDN